MEITRNKPHEKNQRISEEEAIIRLKETREFRQRLKKLDIRAESLEKNWRISEEELAARNRLEKRKSMSKSLETS